MRRLSLLLAASLLAACGHPPVGAIAPRASAPRVAAAAQPRPVSSGQLTIKLTPESSEAAARTRALAWAKDAELRFVGWLMYRGEAFSTVNHTFYSPERTAVLAVTTFFQDGWQASVEFDTRLLVRPMETLRPLPVVPVTARQAYQSAVPYLDPASSNPWRGLTLVHPSKAVDPFWLVAGGNNLVYENARTGAVVGVPPYGLEGPYPAEWSTPHR